MHMTVTLVRLGDQRFFIASRDVPLGCHPAHEPQPHRSVGTIEGVRACSRWSGHSADLWPGRTWLPTLKIELDLLPRRQQRDIFSINRVGTYSQLNYLIEIITLELVFHEDIYTIEVPC
jgi:hypothetical protein